MTRILAVRLDSVGDVLCTGPALRPLRAGLPAGGSLDLLVSPAGAAAARLLPARWTRCSSSTHRGTVNTHPSSTRW